MPGPKVDQTQFDQSLHCCLSVCILAAVFSPCSKFLVSKGGNLIFPCYYYYSFTYFMGFNLLRRYSKQVCSHVFIKQDDYSLTTKS